MRLLTAEWRHLLMLNFTIEPGILTPLVPKGTELDDWNGSTYMSLVAFRFLNTRLKGVSVPFHRDFEEINLRFYVRAYGAEGMRRGVVFIREIVPRRAIASVARWLYNENYVACPTRSRITEPAEGSPGTIEYGWKHNGTWLSLGATVEGEPIFPAAGSSEEFITEHYWGYTTQRDGSTREYRVEHPQWRVWKASNPAWTHAIADYYGPEFAAGLSRGPVSAFVADGSAVIVNKSECLSRNTVA